MVFFGWCPNIFAFLKKAGKGPPYRTTLMAFEMNSVKCFVLTCPKMLSKHEYLCREKDMMALKHPLDSC